MPAREELPLDHRAYDMAGDLMCLLHLRRHARGHAQAVVAQREHLPASGAGEAHRRHALRPRRAQRGQDVGRAAGGREGEEHVAGRAQCLHLAGKDAVVAIIVADRRQHGAVGGERNRRQAGAVVVETGDQLARPVLRIRGAAPVAAEQELAARGERRDRDPDDAGDGSQRLPVLGHALQRGGGIEDGVADLGGHAGPTG
jgi:hypothetical protein